VLQVGVGAHKLSVVGNTIYILLQISSGMLLPKIMKIGLRIKKVIAKIKRVWFFETQCSIFGIYLLFWLTG